MIEGEGVVEKIQEKQKLDGSVYYQLVIDEVRYTLHDETRLEYVNVGDRVQFTYQSKCYSNFIKTLRKVTRPADDSIEDAYVQPED